MFKRMRNERGFTLVEILVVLAIMAILVALVIPNLTGLLSTATSTAKDQEKDTVQSAIDAYYTQDYKVEEKTQISARGTAAKILITDTTQVPFVKYLRRDTKYEYSWSTDGEDLAVQ